MRIRTLVLSAAGASLLATSALAGTITGTIVYDDKVPNLRPITMNADPACDEMHDEPVQPDLLVLGEGNTLANVFVKVTDPPESDSPVPSDPVVIDQQGCMYAPHVVGVRVGQPLQFRNSDGILHNVHGLPEKNREFNLGMPASLKEKETTFNKPEELFPVKCDVHPWMKAYVAVMTHPFFDVTGEDGAFALDGLPDGTYTVEAWHEKLGTRSQEVSVSGGEADPVEFTFQVPR